MMRRRTVALLTALALALGVGQHQAIVGRRVAVTVLRQSLCG